MSTETLDTPVRLTELSHGGGCGCKIAPGVLRELLAGRTGSVVPPQLLVGLETGDDAAVYALDERNAVVATTDFFMPIVDDPFDFGAIAATNALSDIYAMGGTPLFALALVAMPIDRLPREHIRRVLAGGEAACARARIPVAGGHSIDSVEPIYGLAAIGRVDPARIKRNAGARAGDVLILGKPLGIGLYGAAVKKRALSPSAYRDLVAMATRLNTPGTALGLRDDVHAMTDVTGFGLLGHLLGMCRASGIAANIVVEAVPRLPEAMALARSGFITGASARNWASYGDDVSGAAADDPVLRALLTDPQTSGGLLVACAPEAADEVLALFEREGFDDAARIGECVAGAPGVHLR
jgi:selenide,water dikinase